METLDPGKVRDVEREMRDCLAFIRGLPVAEACDFERGRERLRLRRVLISQVLAERRSR